MGLYNPLISEFTLHDAGFLICDYVPIEGWNPSQGAHNHEEGIIRERARMTTNELVRYARDGRLEVFEKNGQPVTFRKDKLAHAEYKGVDDRILLRPLCEDWIAKRSELERWAREKNILPVFLFPDQSEKEENLFSLYCHISFFTLAEAGFLLSNHKPLEEFRVTVRDEMRFLLSGRKEAEAWQSAQGVDSLKEIRSEAGLLAEQLEKLARSGELKVFDAVGNQITFKEYDGFGVLSESEYENRIQSEKGRGLILTYRPQKNWNVKRDDLVNLVNKKGLKPEFLFPVNERQNVSKGVRTAPGKKWFDLNEAAKRLSAKTKEEWNAERIIDFSISQCKPDDIVEDYKYPSYLRSTIPHETKGRCNPHMALHVDNPEEYGYVFQSIKAGSDKIYTTFLFKRNLEEIKADGKSRLLYVEYDNQAVPDSNLYPVIAYYDLIFWGPRVILLDGPSPQFSLPPCIEINHKTIGIRDEELKQLLRDYLTSPGHERNQERSEDQREQFLSEQEKDLIVDGNKYLESKKRSHAMDEVIEKAIEESGSDTADNVLRQLKTFAEQEGPPWPLTGGFGTNYVEYVKSNEEKADYTKDALRKKIERRKRTLEGIDQKNGH